MPATNSLNINTTGVVSYDSTTGFFTQSEITQYSTLVAGADNSIVSVGPGLAGQILQSGGVSANPAFSTATYPSTTTVSELLYSSSANTVEGLATGNNGVLITSSGGVPSFLANGTTGQVLTATTGSPPSWTTVGTALTWVDITSGSQAIAVNTGYITDNATTVTYSLPTTAAQGSIFEISCGTSAAATTPFSISQAAGQSIKFGNQTSTTGVGGSVASTLKYDSIKVLCVVANTTFVVLSSVGNFIVT
jgi:hypothetical protein